MTSGPRRPRPLARGVLLLALANAAVSGCRRGAPPYGPARSLSSLRLEAGFRAELYASEPAIASPVAMDFDEHGRLFVVEMPGYPLDKRATGRVKLLEDGDADGRPDRATVFADGLVLPTGVMRWKRGVLVTAAPDVVYLEDADGDGRAERRRVLLTGFAVTNPQHTVNTPVYGLDNWIYLAHEGPAEAVIFQREFGDQGGLLHFPDRPDGPRLDPQRRAVRFRPEQGGLEALAGRTQFGHAFDAWGRYFTLDNSNHVRHEVLAARYLARNPRLLTAPAVQDVSDHGAAAAVYPLTARPQVELLTEAGQFTSACSLTFCAGAAFPPPWDRASLVAEPVHNLVHADLWEPDGATFVARRAVDGREFLASTDPWFRPVAMSVGPDGALYVVDYYREVIEHPEWGARHRHREGAGLYRGSDRGRIYRVVHGSGPAPLPREAWPARSDTAGLVRLLAHPNAWWRRTAQRLLVDRRPPEAVALLERSLEESPSALGRLHALWTLDGLGALSAAMVERTLRDPAAGVRENALRLAEPLLPSAPWLAERLADMAGEPDTRARFQLLCTLGSVASPGAAAARERLLFSAIEDPWMPLAALTARDADATAVLVRASRDARLTAGRTEGRTRFFGTAAAVVGAGQKPDELQRAIALAAGRAGPRDAWWTTAVLDGLRRGLTARPGGDALRGSHGRLLRLAEGDQPGPRRAAVALLELSVLPRTAEARAALGRAAARARDPATASDARVDALHLLAAGDARAHADLFRAQIDARQPEAVQAAAVRALGRAEAGADAARFLLPRWRALSGPVRSEAAEVLVSDRDAARLLLAALREGNVQPWTLAFGPKRDLLMHADPALREEARDLLERPLEERERVIRRYAAALERKGDAVRGREIHSRLCARCHGAEGSGDRLGPDLRTVRHRPESLLLRDILAPSESIAAGYEWWVAERRSGASDQGLLVTQSPTAIVLRTEAAEVVIPREEVRSLSASALSAMPADLDRELTAGQMADLLAFLRRPR